jgi:hypothetical protein
VVIRSDERKDRVDEPALPVPVSRREADNPARNVAQPEFVSQLRGCRRLGSVVVAFEAAVHGVMRDPQGNDRVGLEVRGTISRSEFGLRWQQALETGGVVVGDEVRISADLSAVCTTPGSEATAA